ncbi:hypothetical protein B484DRAFT_449713 [Ochromonadaceae sp. CCMP2298]|nr:hypothetical protein B484DRAFT_449713 [Ochromonadaceae sp. CCMP2298]
MFSPSLSLPPRYPLHPSLIVDVKLSATKTVKIPIWIGDDPLSLAQSFALIYSLDVSARDLLAAVIRQSMEQNGMVEIAPAPEVGVTLVPSHTPAPLSSNLANELSDNESDSSSSSGESVYTTNTTGSKSPSDLIKVF